MNWFKRQIYADKGDKPESIYEGTPLENWGDEIVHMERQKSPPGKKGPFIERQPNGETHKNEVVQITFRIGDRVRNRQRGAAEKQQYGKIVNIAPDDDGNDCYHIRWDGNDEIQKIRLNDAVAIGSLLSRV